MISLTSLGNFTRIRGDKLETEVLQLKDLRVGQWEEPYIGLT